MARRYARMFLDDLEPDQWAWQPGEGQTHIAWQVGHLAVAQYSLALMRIRGHQEADEAWIGAAFRKRYGKGSAPQAVSTDEIATIQATFDRVFDTVMETLPAYSDEQLDVPLDRPHPLFTTKLGGLEWCSRHELIHTGQIALLRRLMGKQPLR